MRIAIANWTSRLAGGVETYLGALVPALRQHGHDVLFCHELSDPAKCDPIPGVPDGSLVQLGSPSTSADGIRTIAAWKPEVVFVHRLENTDTERTLLTLAPGVFFAHGYHGTCISGTKTTRFPVVQQCERVFGAMCLLHYFPRRCGGRHPITMLSEYRRQSARLELLRHYRSLVTFSQHMRREYLKHGFSADGVHQVPAVDPMEHAARSRSRLRAEQHATEQSAMTRLAFIGRVAWLKGLHLLIEALPAIRAATRGRLQLTVAGDGPDLARCQRLASTIALTLPDTEMLFVGWASTSQCEAILDMADVLVVPSVWPEPFGLVGIEAQRRSVPVAAFRVGGIPEWLRDGQNGALASAAPPTAAGIAEAVIRCLTSSQIRERTHSRAQDHISYSIEGHLERLLPVLAAASGTSR